MWRRAKECVEIREHQCLLTNLNLTRDLTGRNWKISINKSSMPPIIAADDDCIEGELILRATLLKRGLPLSVIVINANLMHNFFQ